MKTLALACLLAVGCGGLPEAGSTEQPLTYPPPGGWVTAGPYFCADNFNPFNLSYAPPSYWPTHGYCRWQDGYQGAPAYRVSACGSNGVGGQIDIYADVWAGGTRCSRITVPPGQVFTADYDYVEGNGFYAENPHNYDGAGTHVRIRSIVTYGHTFLETCDAPMTYPGGFIPGGGACPAGHFHELSAISDTQFKFFPTLDHDVVSFNLGGSY